MKILWLNWKDLKNPLAGGAEVVNEELAKRLVERGHEVILLTAGFAGSRARETIDGYEVIRVGNRLTVYFHAWRYYRKNLRNWADLVIDEVNTMPFFAKFYVKEPNIVWADMLCREIWFHQLPLPLSLVGYVLEPLYLRLLRDRRVITISESSKRDLVRAGFREERISIVSLGIEIPPISDLSEVEKYSDPTLLSLGAFRAMKRTAHQVKAFELVRATVSDAKLKIAGDSAGRYGQRVLEMIAASPYSADIEYLGKVSQAQKVELMQRCHLIMVTSVKEGWGLIVTEAASQGTPAVVYDVDGLRDSVRHGQTGLVCARNTPACLAESAVKLLRDADAYAKVREEAWRLSLEITFERSYSESLAIMLESE
jgi:glycosyltransferase involved in cell wall biosynthesis